jgi:hypothetical protein
MHLNYYQAFDYLGDDLDHVVLLTPNEGLTRQHREAMQKSGIDSVHVNDLRDGGGMLDGDDTRTVKVVEIYLLDEEETDGGKKVAVDRFEGDNLVFVDEGHKGAQSDADTSWFSRRQDVVGGGMTFEYSATYGQAVSKGSTGVDFEEEYGRSIVVDYSYQRFYEDGYGKDFRILNLDPGTDEVLDANDEVERRYLLANLLAFYEQQYVFDRNQREFVERFHLERPLLVFIGHSVTGGKTVSAMSKTDKQAATDVQRLVRFLHQVLRNEDGWAEAAIDELLQEDGSLEIGEDAFFEDRFHTLRDAGLSGSEVLSQMRTQLFHADGGRLHLVNINNVDGEIGLRAGDSDEFFGVIDVGNDRDFMKLVERGLDDVAVDLEGSDFETALFKKIDHRDSPINVLMGSRKFIEGWSSWRVASMGLMNFGRGKGPQIIQLFGRGVRLLGWNRTLKRTSALPEEADVRPPSDVGVLETLNIFGVRAKYMESFREYLEDEGIEEVAERQTFRIQTRMHEDLDAILDRDLPLVGPDPDAVFDEPLSLHPDEAAAPTIDLTPQMEVILSTTDEETEHEDEAARRHVDDRPGWMNGTGDAEAQQVLLNLLDWQRLYHQCWRHRTAEGFDNLYFDAADLRSVIEARAYTLKCPDWMIDWRTEEGRRRIESITRRILEAYLSRFYSRRKAAWEQTTFRRESLAADHDNFVRRTQAEVKVTEEEKIEDYEETLRHVGEKDGEDLYEGTDAFYQQSTEDSPSRVSEPGHLYVPLMTQADGASHTPVGLNDGEEQFVKDLGALLRDDERRREVMGEADVYFLRNQSRGHGMAFLMRNGKRFYPDFVLWILDGDHRHVVFVDPKGIVHSGSVTANPKFTFCREGIREVEAQVRDANEDPTLSLHAFIVSVSDYDDVAQNQNLDSVDAFNDHHIYFQKDQDDYVEKMLRRVLQSRTAGAAEG